MTDLPRQDGSGGAAGETITPPSRAVLGIRFTLLIVGLALGIVLACGDPNDSGPTVGTLAGTVHDAETDAPLEGVLLVVAGRQGQSAADGTFEIDSVPTGTQQVTVSMAGYVGQAVEIEVEGGETATLALELVPDLGPPGPTNVTAATDDGAPGTVIVMWDAVEGATGYTVYWGTHSPVNAEQGTAVPNAPKPFVHSELSAGTTYYYAVVAHGPDGDTRPSAEVSATPDGPISIRFVNPTPTQIVDARFVVSVEISSVFQLLGATAQVEDLTDELTYIPASDEWEGFFDVGDMPSPSFRTVHYTATDAMGNVARTAVLVRLDRLPVVTMSQPQDDALASPSIRVVATCMDDNPAGCESLTISVSDGSRTITKAVGQATVDQVISLAEFDGQVVDLRAGGRDVVQDRIHRTPSVTRTVYVDATPGLTAVATSGSGTLIDADAVALLAVDGQSDGFPAGALRIVDRVSGQSTVIHDQLPELARAGALFPGGAIFFTRGDVSGSMWEWRNGTSSVISTGVSETSFEVEGSFAIWTSSDGLIRRDVTSGTNVNVVSGNTNGDVAATGEVVWAGRDVFLFEDGINTQLTSDGGDELGNVSPVTDGINVVYQRRSFPPADFPGSIMLVAPGDDIVLGADIGDRSPFGIEPHDDYEVADGWIAFGRLDVSSTQQIWRRSPDGEEAQVSAFGEPSTIEAMGPDGEVVFTSNATGTVRRYRARVGESPEDVSTGLGKPVYIDGQLHLMMGATLLDVD
jgi:Carboxypeptidase regulatory-like domain